MLSHEIPQGISDIDEVKNRSVRTISREVGGDGLLTPQRLHAELLERLEDEDIVHAPRRRGEHVNKVAVPEGAAGSPPF